LDDIDRSDLEQLVDQAEVSESDTSNPEAFEVAVENSFWIGWRRWTATLEFMYFRE